MATLHYCLLGHMYHQHVSLTDSLLFVVTTDTTKDKQLDLISKLHNENHYADIGKNRTRVDLLVKTLPILPTQVNV